MSGCLCIDVNYRRSLENVTIFGMAPFSLCVYFAKNF